MNSKILVTSALPYANGPIHIGHLVEYIQTDVYVRFLRLTGRDVIYCCADDAHGTAIEISAAQANLTPEALVEQVHAEHIQDFREFLVDFDSYYTTHSPENERWANRIFETLRSNGDIVTRKVERTYCPECSRFLPDRYVRGTCPRCGGIDQYGDVCEKCNATYSTSDLIEPHCSICGNTPELRESEHYFFQLVHYENFLRQWLEKADWLQSEVGNYLLNWIDQGLRDWEVSRDGPYFGFRIPGESNKFFYVWLDAPIGYIASTEHYCSNSDRSVEEYWESEDSRIIHFIGKDIIYFHFLFWPAMLKGGGLSVPDRLCVHGFLTVNGEKMSKSRGTFLTARQFLEHFDAEYLRFYYAKLTSNRVSDVDLSFEDFQSVINTELAANIGNFANRVLSFLGRNYGGEIKGVSDIQADMEVRGKVLAELAEARLEFEAVNLAGAVRRILAAGSIGNKYFQDTAPWALIKDDRELAHRKVGLAVNIVRNLAIALSPILPRMTSELGRRLGFEIKSWDQIGFEMESGTVGSGTIPVTPIKELPVFEKPSSRRISITVHPEVTDLGINCCLAQVEATTVRSKSGVMDAWRKAFEATFCGLSGKEEPLLANKEAYIRSGLEAQAPYEHLAQLLADGGKLPSLNPAVDVGNVVSLKRLVSVGMHDADRISGNIHLRLARSGDRYVPLGETHPANLTPKTFVFVDDDGTVLCWLDVKQGNESPVTIDSCNILVITSGNPAVADAVVEEAAREIAEKVVEVGGGKHWVVPVPLFGPELRAARVLLVEDHPDADRLYVLQVDLGCEQRQIVAGLRQAIPKNHLEGTNIVVVANLVPATLRGKESNGMLLAASKGKRIVPLTANVSPGTLVAPAPCQVGSVQIDIQTFAKYPLDVNGQRVFWKGAELIAEGVPVTVDIGDGAKVS